MQLHFSHTSASVSFSLSVFPMWAAFSSFPWFYAPKPTTYQEIFIVCEEIICIEAGVDGNMDAVWVF